MNRKFYSIIVLGIVVFFGSSCTRPSDEQNFQTSVFINDINEPGLPVYSTLGYNTFGAYYNSATWASSKSYGDYIFEIGTSKDSTGLFFMGIDNANKSMEMVVLITKNTIAKVDDLIAFNNRSFNLQGDSVKIKMDNKIINVQNGSINFTSVRRLIVNKSQIGIILSGTFEVNGTVNGANIQLRKGRFDICVQSIMPRYLREW